MIFDEGIALAISEGETMGPIQKSFDALVAYVAHNKPNPDIGKKIEKVRKEIETFQQSIPSQKLLSAKEKKEKFKEANNLKLKLLALTQKISSSQMSALPAAPVRKVIEVQASRGLSLNTLGGSANPVATVTQQHFISLEKFKDFFKYKNIQPIVQISEQPDPTVSKLFFISCTITDYSARSLFNNIKWEYELRNPGKLYDAENFKTYVTQYVKKMKASPDDLKKSLEIIMGAIDSPDLPKTKDEMATIFLNLISGQTEGAEGVVEYEFNEVKKEMNLQLEQQVREYNLQNPSKAIDLNDAMDALDTFLLNKQIPLGNYLSQREAEHLVHYINEGLHTTYGRFKLTPSLITANAAPYLNTLKLYEMYSDIPGISGLIETLPGFDPTLKVAVAKGGLEAFREPMMIHLAENFNLQNAVLMKEVMTESNLSAKGIPLQVVAPFIPGLKTTPLYQLWVDIIQSAPVTGSFIPDKTTYAAQLEQLRSIVTPEAYGESLALSLLLHATDDHPEQFALMDDHLVNYDMGRNLPPARSVFTHSKVRDYLFINLRSVLIDYPQLDDPLSRTVVDKISAITPERIEESLSEARISEFAFPHDMRRILQTIRQFPPKTDPEKEAVLELLTKAGNRQAAMRLKDNFTNPKVYKELLDKAVKGCEYPRSLAVHRLRMLRDFHEKHEELSIVSKYLEPFLKQAGQDLEFAIQTKFKDIIPIIETAFQNSTDKNQMLHLKGYLLAIDDYHAATDYLDETGTTADKIPILSTDEQEKITQQIAKVIRASVDEREIERMKEGQKKVIAKIEAQQGHLTGRELAETLYPDEMLILDAYKDLDYFVPSLFCAGTTLTDVNFLIEYIQTHSSPKFDKARIDKLLAAQARLKEEACDQDFFNRYCVGNKIDTSL